MTESERLLPLGPGTLPINENTLHSEQVTKRSETLNYMLRSNGYTVSTDEPRFHESSLNEYTEQLKWEKVSFLGPSGWGEFFKTKHVDTDAFIKAFDQKKVVGVIEQIRRWDEDKARHVSYLFGGIIRHLSTGSYSSEDQKAEMKKTVNFMSDMVSLGGGKSSDAVASAMAMYLLSGGKSESDDTFRESVYHMAGAVEEDTIEVHDTVDLGISQVGRLRSFEAGIFNGEKKEFPDISGELVHFEDFPTVGAEFHFPLEASHKHNNFWQRLSLLNISQYQEGSSIQFSRNDRGIIEVRMNPSVYPVTIATWNHMRKILPELNQAYFTMTFNRRGKDENFVYKNDMDEWLVKELRGIGLLSFAALNEAQPKPGKSEEVDFGTVYLGQTVRCIDGKYIFNGAYDKSLEDSHGQVGLYAGFGNNFPYLAYYPSMFMASRGLLDNETRQTLLSTRTLDDAYDTPAEKITNVFQTIQRNVSRDTHLRSAFEAGERIQAQLNS